MKPTINVFPSIEAIAEAVAGMFIELLRKPGEELIHIALSGGNTPKVIFNYLNKTYGNKLTDNRFHFWWGDDRCVPPSNDESNYKWAYEQWLQPIGIAEGNLHRIKGENDPEQEVIRYAEEMKKWMRTTNGFPVIDLNLLGLGEDGHTASIFPHNMALLNSERWCAVATHPTSEQKRITLTGKVLNNSEKVIFITTGAGKAEMIKNVAIEANPEYPASHIKPASGEALWLIDRQAALYCTD
jgi:6-phosphogluconolactonase